MILSVLTHTVAIIGASIAATVPLFLLLAHLVRTGPPTLSIIEPITFFMAGAMTTLVLADLAFGESLGWWFLTLGFPGGTVAILTVNGLMSVEDTLALRRYERERAAREAG